MAKRIKLNGKPYAGKRLSLVSMCMAVMGGMYAASPSVSNVLLTQDGDSQTIIVSYTLANAPAIVTVDVKKGDGTSIGAAALRGLAGDLNKVIAADGSF